MKRRNRIFAMLLSLMMVFTFMPAMAFADNDVSAEKPAEEVTEAAGESVEGAEEIEPTADEVSETPEETIDAPEIPEETAKELRRAL